MTYQKRDDSAITKVNGFIKSSNGNLHRKRKISFLKLLLEWKDGSVGWVALPGYENVNFCMTFDIKVDGKFPIIAENMITQVDSK